jgi:peptidoglycan/xylan/chitin deacetylase (PgdA/CDA1 family)
MVMSPADLENTLAAAADRIEQLAGSRPCRIFRPHAGWRGGQMFEGLARADYKLIGWGWMLWDFNWMRARTAEATFNRVIRRASAGDIVVMHDGDESAPLREQAQTVEATARLIPALRARGFGFGTLCGAASASGGPQKVSAPSTQRHEPHRRDRPLGHPAGAVFLDQT